MKTNKKKGVWINILQKNYINFLNSFEIENQALCYIIFSVVFVCFLNFKTLSQPGKVVFKIIDNTNIPKVEHLQEDKSLILKSANSYLESTFSKYNLYEFKQLYPDALTPELLQYYILDVNDQKKLIADLKKDASNSFTNIREHFEPIPLYTPNDYNFCLRTGNDGCRDLSLSYLDLINVRLAWDITKGDPNIVIGIHDNHLTENHEDLSGKIHKIYDENIRSSFYNCPDHGTMVAGIIAASSDNSIGIPSVAFNCKIAKSSRNKNDLLKMAKDGVKVINLSQNWGFYSEDHQLLINELTNNYNVTVVAAAGNNNDTAYFFPASYDNVISVTSVGHEFERGTIFNNKQFSWKDCHKKYLGSSSINVTHQHNNKVDICAPGYNIITLCRPDTYVNLLGKPTGQLYSIEEGTSFATAIVSGVCALMYTVHPDITPKEVEEIIKLTAADIYQIPENKEYIGLLGAGRIDAYEAVKYAAGIVDSTISKIEETKNEIIIYPNPNHGKIYFSGIDQFDEIRVYNSLGKTVLKTKIESNHNFISIENQNPGMYLIEFNGKNIFSKKYKILKI